MSEQNTKLNYGGNGIEALEGEQTNYIKEWVLIPRALSDAERTQVYNDLAAKWGIPLLDCEEEI
jgi:hypothetical protein